MAANLVLPPVSSGVSTLRRIEDLPGPRRWPWLGNLPQMRMSRIHRDIEAWGRKFGPLFKVDIGSSTMLVVTDHETIRSVLRDRPDRFRRTSRLRTVSAELGGDRRAGLFSAEGEAWRNQRRMVMASFAARHIRSYFPSLLTVTRHLQARWHMAARERTSIDLQADLKRFTMDAIAGLAFGIEVNTLESGKDEIPRHLDVILAGVYRRMLLPVPYWRYLRLPADRRLERSLIELRTAIDGFILQARERLGRDPELRDKPGNLLEAMIAAADEGSTGLTDADVAANVSTMLFAGVETTADTLAWLIYMLYRNPSALRLAQMEVWRVAPDPARFHLEQFDALTYVDACANEAMRLKPASPYNAVEALYDTTISDIQVPAGTLVWCVTRHYNIAEHHFPDSPAFDPQGWLDAGTTAQGASSVKRITTPFGSGPRMCPGRYLALLEIKLATAMLLSTFEIEAVDTPDGREAREKMSFTMRPVGLRMRLSARG